MTSIVGIKCRDGVVIGADSSATFGDGGHVRTIEQPTERKIDIIGDQIIIAGTGYVGHGQRFQSVVKKCWDDKEFMNKSELEIAKMLSREGLRDFAQTHVQQLEYAALVAYPAGDKPCLCELPRGAMTQTQPTAFQPELKNVNDFWFASSGSGQPITDSFLALFRDIFWKDGPPNVRGGIFTALWALRHACEVNTGGIKGPVRIAVLQRQGGKLRAQMLDENEIAEHENVVTDATEHMRSYLDVLEGKEDAKAPPEPPAPQS